jgi:diguanylate cyclase (GGDEF)-like protein/PAS domain S-box-containing protein
MRMNLSTVTAASVLESVDGGILVFDAAGHLLTANTSAATLLRLTTDQMSGSGPLPTGWRLSDEGDESRSHQGEQTLAALLPGPGTWRQVRQLQLPGGEDRWLEISVAPDSTEDVVVTLVDVTDERRSTTLVEDAVRTFGTMVESGNEGLATFDRGNHITYANRRWCELTGYSHEELVGRNLVEVEPSSQVILERMWRELKAVGSSRFEMPLVVKQGTQSWVLVSAGAIYDEGGDLVGSAAMLTDLTEQKAMQQVLDYLSLHDPLTDIPNRRLFQDRLGHALVEARRDGTRLALMVLDLDGFKQVNDSFGHTCGDAVLREVAARLKLLLRESDTVARMGGDEFALLLRMGSNASDAEVVSSIDRIRERLHEPMLIDDQMIEIDVSIGVAMYPRDGEDPDTLYRCADSAMFEAKREHVDYLVYTSALERVAPSDVIIARELREALRLHQLDIVYQPELDLASGDLVRVEALVRWNHPLRGPLLPHEFIPAAERTRVMAQVTRWVLSSVIQQLRQWCDAGWHVNVSVNLSAWDLCDPRLPKYVQDLLEHWQVDPLLLTIETTETVLMADPERARETLRQLRELGITLSLDDFGTGYSSLTFIRDLPSQEIKIDQSFIRNLDHDVNSATIVRALIQLAHELGRVTVAEGIETPEAWSVLKTLGCDTGQGFLMAHPMKPTDLEYWLQTHTPGACP